MYLDELTAEKQEVVAQQYVAWLLHFHRNQLVLRDYSAMELNNLCELLLDYTPSVYRDGQRVYFYRTTCLHCATTLSSSRQYQPHSIDCHECCKLTSILVMEDIANLTTNPMSSYFDRLPTVVQLRVSELLIDLGRHPSYNKSSSGRTYEQSVRPNN